jgi:DNA topoisomerase I
MELVIVESPIKAKTIQKFLGSSFKVLSSYGHVRDLPKNRFGVDLERNFQPKYVVPQKAKKVVKEIKTELKKSENIILATDEDREGEAIAWHLYQALNLKEDNCKRIVFHEITEKAIKRALESPRKININLVDAQQARRILDRIVGYKLSPFLWKKIVKGLSAGRVQSVAVRIIVDREEEIKKFEPQEYWQIKAILNKEEKDFESLLSRKKNEEIPKLGIKIKEEAEKIIENLEGAEYKVEEIKKKEIKRNPLPPFTTSTLQQEGWKRFRMPAKFTMRLAQNLYEKGLITYHRTDSLNLSESSLSDAKKIIIKNYGKDYWPGFKRKYKAKGRAQEAHEAIRPTNSSKEPGRIKLDSNQFKIYKLIWERFIACQMSQAEFDATQVKIKAKEYIFKTSGQILKFDGFLRVYSQKFKESELPDLKKDDVLKLIKLEKSQHFTKPPARFTEGSLIKELEKNGIGRPSTYAPVIATIKERNYVNNDEQRRFCPTEIGIMVNDLLVKHFPQIVDIKFTAKMEKDLDKIAQGEKEWTKIIKDFYNPFEKNLIKKQKEVAKKETDKKTEQKCPKCGSPLLIKLGRFGKFFACSNFPECKFSKPLPPPKIGVKCPECKEGEMVERKTRKGKIFFGCNKFPECKFATWDKPINRLCPKCKKLLVETKSGQIKCSSKECNFKEEKIDKS